MNEGTSLLWIALIFALGATASLSAYVVSGAKNYRKLGRILLLANFTAISASFLLMIYYFLSSNMEIAYVHSNSSVDYDWYYKLAGVWSGDDGSLLLWTWFLSLVTLLFFIERKNDSKNRAHFRSLTSTILMIITAVFTYILIVADPFQPTAPMFLVTEGIMNGFGMSPLLLTPLVIIHPPLEFAAYAVIAVPFAAAMAHLLKGESQWTRIAMQWTRIAWVFLTMAIVIGALWAYTVLGWGGYWAWDPVETSNLVIWLPLTALVHAQLWNRRKGQFSHVAPMLAGVVFSLTLFATFETRTGVIISIHSFSISGGFISNDLGARLLSVLESGDVVPLFYIIMCVSLLVTAALFMLYFARLRRKENVASRLMQAIPWIFLVIFSFAAIWMVYDAHGLTEVFLNLSNSLSFGYPALGFMILAGILIGVPILWILATSPTEEDNGKGLKAWISDDGAMNVALALFILWTLVTIALMIIGANALNPADFEYRLPFLLIPVGIALFAGLTWRIFKKSWTPYAILILGFLVILSFALFSSNVGALYFPIVLALIFATGFRIYKSWAPAILSKTLQIAAMFIFTSLALAFVMWSSLLTDAGIPFVAMTIPFELGFTFATVSVIALFLLAGAVSKFDLRLWVGSALLGIALIGFVIGLILSAIALILVVYRIKDLRTNAKHRKISFTSILRGASPQLVHLGVALLVLGYATSTYFASESQITAVRGLNSGTPSGYQFQLLSSNGIDHDGDGFFESITANIEVSKNDVRLFTLFLEMQWRTEGVNYPHYLSNPVINSGPTGDLFFTFLSFSAGGSSYSINDDPASRSNNDTLQNAIFHLRENPGMVSLWGGAWLMILGMSVRMWSEKNLYRLERPEEETLEPKARPSPPKKIEQPEDDYYRKLLDEELRMEDIK